MQNIIETIRKEVEKSGKSRYRIAQESGVSEVQLHRMMEKNQSLYCSTAEVLLEYFGYELTKKGDIDHESV